MSLMFREGALDLLILAGPRLSHWPSVGVRTLARITADFGLNVGVYGGDDLSPRGIMPLPGTGAIALLQDVQGRVHRMRGRAIARIGARAELPDPFDGWYSDGLIPLSTAHRLIGAGDRSHLSWGPATVILGTGNAALQFGVDLIERFGVEVACIEVNTQWGAKRFAAWEVIRRRFEVLGGRIIEARPLSLRRMSAQLWELRVEDARGVKILEATRVVSAGPFRTTAGLREFPPGSMLFELEATASPSKRQDFEGWYSEEERARALAVRIIKGLVADLGGRREELDRIQKRARARLKRIEQHRLAPFSPSYQGKWVSPGDAKQVRAFAGVPQTEHHRRPVASIECFEAIVCNLCETACPEGAIQFSKDRTEILIESKCTACGLCLPACPSSTPLLLQEKEGAANAQITLPWRNHKPWRVGELSTLVNRRGESLGSGRVSAVTPVEGSTAPPMQLVQVEVPAHLAWDARGLRRLGVPDERYREGDQDHAARIEIQLNGERRLVRDGVPIVEALYETGQSRPREMLFCPDGSCGMCQVEVDGVKKLACKESMHPKLSLKLERETGAPDPDLLCPCLKVTLNEVRERIRQGKLESPEAVISATHVGEGRCHGQLCIEGFRRVLASEGLVGADAWIDWRFPWSDWVLTTSSNVKNQ